MTTAHPQPSRRRTVAAFTLTVVFISLSGIATASSAVTCLFDDFESYSNLVTLAAQSTWECWFGDAARDAYVTDDLSSSPTQCLELAPPCRVVHGLDGWAYGAHELKLHVYVPGDFDSGSPDPLAGSYLRLLSVYEPDGTVECTVQLNFDSNDGMLKVYHGNGMNTNNTPYVPDEWGEIQCVVDLDGDRAQVFYNGLLVADYPYSAGATGQGSPLVLRALELDANYASPVYYDDVRSLHPSAVENDLAGFPVATLAAPVPNPFNAGTSISYELATAGPARLAVHDPRGRFITLLADGYHTDGPHSVTWDGRDAGGQAVASGAYFLRLESPGGGVATRALVLLK